MGSGFRCRKALSFWALLLCILSVLQSVTLAVPVFGINTAMIETYRNFLFDEIDADRLDAKKLIFYTTRDSRNRKTYGRENAEAFADENKEYYLFDDVFNRKFNVKKWGTTQRENAWKAFASIARGEPVLFAPDKPLSDSTYARIVEPELDKRRRDRKTTGTRRMITNRPPATRPETAETPEDSEARDRERQQRQREEAEEAQRKADEREERRRARERQDEADRKDREDREARRKERARKDAQRKEEEEAERRAKKGADLREKQKKAKERERQRQNKWAEERDEQFRKENEEAERKERQRKQRQQQQEEEEERERQKARQQKRPEQPGQPPVDEADADPEGYYETLGVSSTATDGEIKKAFRRLALSSHPDKHPNDPGAKARFQKINEANGVLSDPTKRAQYDDDARLESLRKNMGGFDFGADTFNRGPPSGAFRPEPNPPRGQSSSYYTREARPSWADSDDEDDRRDSRRRRPPPRAPPPEAEEIPEGPGWTKIASPNARGVWYNDGRAKPRGFYKKMGLYWASVRDPDLGSRACKRSPDGTCATGPDPEEDDQKVRKRPSRSSTSEAEREAASGDDEGDDGEGFDGDDQRVKPGTKNRNMKPTGGAPKKDSSSDSRRTSSKPPPRPPPTRPH